MAIKIWDYKQNKNKLFGTEVTWIPIFGLDTRKILQAAQQNLVVERQRI